MSAAEQQLVGWPLPASLVERMESMRSRVEIFCKAGTREALSTDTTHLQNSSLDFTHHILVLKQLNCTLRS